MCGGPHPMARPAVIIQHCVSGALQVWRVCATRAGRAAGQPAAARAHGAPGAAARVAGPAGQVLGSVQDFPPPRMLNG